MREKTPMTDYFKKACANMRVDGLCERDNESAAPVAEVSEQVELLKGKCLAYETAIHMAVTYIAAGRSDEAYSILTKGLPAELGVSVKP